MKRGNGVQCPAVALTVEFHDETRKHTHQSLSTDLRTGVGVRIRRESRLSFLKADERISIVDGAAWIQTRLGDSAAQLKLDGLGLDFHHFAENVHKCRRLVFGAAVVSNPGRRKEPSGPMTGRLLPGAGVRGGL